MERTQTLKVVFSLLVIFLLSVAVRYPNINRPLSKHHEYITAVSLRVLQIWGEEGAAKYNYNPVMNYNGSANKFINNHASTTGGMIDKEGNYYYVSHPQFAYILPHSIFTLFHIKPTVLSLQIFNLLINFLSAVFVYLIICLLCIQRPFKKLFFPGLIGFLIYSFNPSVLWFQSNVYMSDTLVHLPFILLVYTFLKLLMRKRFYSKKYLIYYAVFLFIMIYTSWLGLFFALSIFLYSLIKLRFEKVFIPLIFITIGVSVVTVLFIINQYSYINGTREYLIQMVDRFFLSESFGSLHFLSFMKEKLVELVVIGKNYLTFYLPIFLLFISFLFYTSSKKKMGFVFTKNAYRFLWLSTLPILFLHLFLLNYSGHGFVALYGSLYLSVTIGVLYSKMESTNVLKRKFLFANVFLVLFLSIGIYYFINRPGDYSMYGELYGIDKNIGETIKSDAKSDEIVYISDSRELKPQLITYAERNIIPISKDELLHIGANTNYVFYQIENDKIIEIIRD